MSSTNRLSSTSLAGSYLSLPQYKPYSAHDIETPISLEETPEKERSNFDYTRQTSTVDEISINDMTRENEQKDNNIVFYESPNDDESVEEEIEQYYEEVEENILECIEEDVVRVDAEGIEEEIIMEKNIDAKDNAENINMTKDNITERDIVDESTEEYSVDKDSDNGEAENEYIVQDFFSEGDIPEFVENPVDDILEDDGEADSNLKDVYVNGSY